MTLTMVRKVVQLIDVLLRLAASTITVSLRHIPQFIDNLIRQWPDELTNISQGRREILSDRGNLLRYSVGIFNILG